MSAVTRPRGPLPARVYWVRRALLLAVVVLLVVTAAQLLGGGEDPGSGSDPVAAQAAADQREARPSEQGDDRPGDEAGGAGTDAGTEGAQDRQRTKGEKGTKDGERKKKEPLPAPTGPCEPSDVVVTPVVGKARAGSPVPITLELTSSESEACSWTASRDTLVVKITSGEDDIWTSAECSGRIGRTDVVVRRKTPAEVEMRWSARRSDEGCTYLREWALPGWYHVTAAAYGGEPTDVQFELKKPERPVVERTVAPKPEKGKHDKKGKHDEKGKQDR